MAGIEYYTSIAVAAAMEMQGQAYPSEPGLTAITWSPGQQL